MDFFERWPLELSQMINPVRTARSIESNIFKLKPRNVAGRNLNRVDHSGDLQILFNRRAGNSFPPHAPALPRTKDKTGRKSTR